MPDIGGFLLGYTDVKYKEMVYEWSKKDHVPQSVRLKAKFYSFVPMPEMTLRCTVTERTKEKISCKAFNHFPVEVHYPAQIWDTVTKGDIVLVEVDLVSQPAHQTPVIIGRIKMNESRVENIDFDEDTEGEEEHFDMEVGETLSGNSKIDEDEERMISMERSKGSKKRKGDVPTSQDIAQRSPVKKRVKKDDTSEQSPVSTTPSTSMTVSQSQPSSSSVSSSPKSAVKVSPKKKSQLKSPKKSNPQGPDADSDSSTEEEASLKVSLKKADDVQKKKESVSSSSSSSSEDESQDKAKPSSDQKEKEDNREHTWPETLPMQKKISNQFFCISYTRDTPWCQPVVTEPQTLGERALFNPILILVKISRILT